MVLFSFHQNEIIAFVQYFFVILYWKCSGGIQFSFFNHSDKWKNLNRLKCMKGSSHTHIEYIQQATHLIMPLSEVCVAVFIELYKINIAVLCVIWFSYWMDTLNEHSACGDPIVEYIFVPIRLWAVICRNCDTFLSLTLPKRPFGTPRLCYQSAS